MLDQFEWDALKAIINLQKHGISFEDAAEALVDPEGVGNPDEKHSLLEERFLWIGMSSKGLLSVVFTYRQNGVIYRIISARGANREERGLYDEKKKD